MSQYNHTAIEKKWRENWEKHPINVNDGKKEKYYCLDMFPYPSGSGLHVGHWRGYVISDVWSRYQLLRGKYVIHPMGWDAFGLPAENYAIKMGVHPAISTESNIKNIKRQINEIAAIYDWDMEVNTTDPAFYKWTQWIFVQMFKKGLAYEKEFPINWCPSCKTGLANEEVVNGCCERCGTPVTKKNLRQWMLKITAYADRLLNDLDKLDWPEKVKKMQSEWIGKSYGAEVDFQVDGRDEKITVYTTRPDTLYGATFMVLAPEHKLAKSLATDETREAVEKYILDSSMRSNVDRMQDVIKIRRGAKATIKNALVKGTGGTIDLIDMSDSRGVGNAASSISITNSLQFKTKLNGVLNTFEEAAGNTGADESGQTAETALLYYQTLLEDRLSGLFECQRFYIYWETAEDYHTVHKSSDEHQIILNAGAYDVSAKLQNDALIVDDGWIQRKDPGVIVKVVERSVLGSGVSSTRQAETVCGALKAREGWSGLDAVRNGRVILLSEELLSGQARRTGAAVLLAKAMYPSLFSDTDGGEALRALTQEAYGAPASGTFIYVG